MTDQAKAKKPLTIGQELQQQRTHDAWLAFFFGQESARSKAETFRLLRAAVNHLKDELQRQRDRVKRRLLNSEDMSVRITAQLVAIRDNEQEKRVILTWLHQAPSEIPVAVGERSLRDFFHRPSPKSTAVKPVRRERSSGIPMPVAVVIVRYLIEHGFLPTSSRSTDPVQQAAKLADALMEFFGSTLATRTSLPKQMAGHYLLYRRSAHWPGYYVKGYLRVTEVELLDDAGNSRMPKEWAHYTEEFHVHNGEDGSAAAKEVYVGVLSRKSGYPFILSSLSGERGTERGAPRFTLIHSTVFAEDLHGQAASMTGITVSPFGLRHAWASTVCIERCAAEPARADLGLFSATDTCQDKLRIPPSVVARLQLHGATSTDI